MTTALYTAIFTTAFIYAGSQELSIAAISHKESAKICSLSFHSINFSLLHFCKFNFHASLGMKTVIHKLILSLWNANFIEKI